VLNWYANTFRISEKNITKSGLLRTKVLAWGTLLIVPLEVVNTDWNDNSENVFLLTIFALLIFAALIALIGLLLSPLVHRFWAPDKYLDEWEIDVKRKGMAAGYKVLFGAVIVGLIYSAFTTDFSASEPAEFSRFQLDSLGFALLTLTLGVQTLKQLSLIRPIDENEIEADTSEGTSIGARIAVVFAIFMLFFGPPMFQGVVDGFTDAADGVPPATKSRSDKVDREHST